MKKRIKASIILLSIFIFTFICFAVYILIDTFSSESIKLLPIENMSLNYNNYIGRNGKLDFYNNKFYYIDYGLLSKTFNRCDCEKGQPLICSNVSAIQVDDTYVYYISNKHMYRARLDNMQKELLIENVVKFLVYDKYIIVMRNANNDDSLYTLSYSDRKRRPVFYDLFHGVYWFGIYIKIH